jgi:hypothetical protein
MTYLGAILKAVWAWLVWVFATMWDLWAQFNGFLWTTFILLIGACWAVIENGVKWIAQTVALVEAIAMPQQSLGAPGLLSNVLALCNTFFPLAETVSYLIVYLLLITAIGAYHFVKSWIPTLSGSG